LPPMTVAVPESHFLNRNSLLLKVLYRLQFGDV
jgi:hypothetical protein